MASEKIRFEINTGTDTSAAGQAADQLQAFAAKLTGASPPGACPPHGTERCDHCGDLPVLRTWSDRDRALWDEHPGDLMSRVDSLDGQDQEVPAAQVRQDHGPLVIVWHQPGACPPGCDLPADEGRFLMAQNDDDPYNLDRWNAEIRVLARLQRDARKVATLDPDREVVITAEDLDELENTTDYLALRVRGLVGQSATGNVLAGVLYDELMLYKPIGRESRALALHAYHAALGPMPDQQRRFHDASAMHQIAAATVLDRVIQLGHEHGLPSLHWSMGASCNLVGEVVRTAPGGHTLALLAYWAWFGLLGAGPDGERISVNRLDGVAVRYAHGVNVGIHYDYSDLKAETATS